MDGDGDVEILIGSDGLFVWDMSGAYGEGSSDWPFYRHDIQRTGLGLRILVFGDGFESGDTSTWSRTVP
jgi:hypothetical protein